MTNWTTPSEDDLKTAFGSIFVEQDDGEDFDPTAAAAIWLPMIVAQFRAAIRTGNRVALSKTAGSVPPEAKAHVLVMTAEAIVVNTPRLVGYIVLEGENGPMARMIAAARKFLTDCATKGLSVTVPQDPDPTTLPSGTIWGDAAGTGDENTVKADLSMDAPPY
jgi:hypothetical protein